MNSFGPSFFKIVLPISASLAGIAFGWCMRDFSSAQVSPSGPARAARSLIPDPAAIRADFESSPSHPAVLHTALLGHSASENAASTRKIIDRIVAADSKNMIDLVEAIGDLTRLSDDQIKEAWGGLAGRSPAPGMGGSAAIIYLWSRMSRLGLEVRLPNGWGAENFASTIALEQNRERASELRRKLEAGQALSDIERRVVYSEALRADPYSAVMLWMTQTKPWDFHADGQLFGNALSDPKTRDAIMSQARRWQTDKDLMGSLVSTLAKDWISRDPVAVEQWVNLPAQADVRTRIMEQIVNVRALSNPTDAWHWSMTLPDKERHQALGMSAAQLANNQPPNGAQLVAGLQNPADREVAVREYGRVLAANNLGQWKQWRDNLSANEQAITNASAFNLWVFHEPDNAVAWLNTQPNGPAKDTMIDMLVDVYAARDPQTAAQWIQSIPNPERRKDAAISALSAIGPDQIDSMRIILGALPD